MAVISTLIGLIGLVHTFVSDQGTETNIVIQPPYPYEADSRLSQDALEETAK